MLNGLKLVTFEVKVKGIKPFEFVIGVYKRVEIVEMGDLIYEKAPSLPGLRHQRHPHFYCETKNNQDPHAMPIFIEATLQPINALEHSKSPATIMLYF